MPSRMRPYGRPKSKGRHLLHAVLLGGCSLVFIWASFDRLDSGVIELRRGAEVRLAEDPTMYWAWMVAHLVIVLVCAGLALVEARGFMSLHRSGGS